MEVGCNYWTLFVPRLNELKTVGFKKMKKKREKRGLLEMGGRGKWKKDSDNQELPKW